jgi:RNA-directed DNA polymerase
MAETQGSITVSTKLERIARLAREMPQAALTTLAHYIDIDWLREAYRRTRKNGATADDVVIIFQREQDARRVADVLPKRLAKYGLTLHPEKTRLVDFRRPDWKAPPSPDNGDARLWTGSFDLLGFTHFWAVSRKGYWVVKQKTAANRFRRALKHIAGWCRQYRHEPVREQWTALKRKLLGHFAYFGITGNSRALRNFRHRVIGVWRKCLTRRSQRARVSWEKMSQLLEHYPLPQPRIRSSTVA